jgi:hypothetical protein
MHKKISLTEPTCCVCVNLCVSHVSTCIQRHCENKLSRTCVCAYIVLCACIYSGIGLHQSLTLALKQLYFVHAYTLTSINRTRQCSYSRACACIYISLHQPLQAAALVHAYALYLFMHIHQLASITLASPQASALVHAYTSVLVYAYTSTCINAAL